MWIFGNQWSVIVFFHPQKKTFLNFCVFLKLNPLCFELGVDCLFSHAISSFFCHCSSSSSVKVRERKTYYSVMSKSAHFFSSAHVLFLTVWSDLQQLQLCLLWPQIGFPIRRRRRRLWKRRKKIENFLCQWSEFSLLLLQLQSRRFSWAPLRVRRRPSKEETCQGHRHRHRLRFFRSWRMATQVLRTQSTAVDDRDLSDWARAAARIGLIALCVSGLGENLWATHTKVDNDMLCFHSPPGPFMQIMSFLSIKSTCSSNFLHHALCFHGFSGTSLAF